MQKRKKEVLDGIDREILRILYKKKALVGRQIAEKVGLSSAAIAPRLNSLKEKGIIKQTKVSGIRSFKRKINGSEIQIKSPRSIYWSLDLK